MSFTNQVIYQLCFLLYESVCVAWFLVFITSVKAAWHRYSSSCSHQALTLSVGARFIIWHHRQPFLEECRQGLRHFWECRACLGYSTASRLTLKKALCHTCLVLGLMTNTNMLTHLRKTKRLIYTSPFFLSISLSSYIYIYKMR